MIKSILFLCFFQCALWADIQKNKIIENNVILKKGTQDYIFDVAPLFKSTEGFNTLVDIYVNRYEKVPIDGFIAFSSNMLSVAKAVSEKYKDIRDNVFYDYANIPQSIPKGNYVLLLDVLSDGKKIEGVVEDLAKKNVLILEVACITEILHHKARAQIQAQVMSIFLKRETAQSVFAS